MLDAPTPTQAPFLIEHRRDAESGRGFVPSARLILTPALRTSGLWLALPPEELRDLLLVLTFLTPNGWIRPTLFELAGAMNASLPAARRRLERLARRQWRGAPVAVTAARLRGPGRLGARTPLLSREEAPREARSAPRPVPRGGAGGGPRPQPRPLRPHPAGGGGGDLGAHGLGARRPLTATTRRWRRASGRPTRRMTDLGMPRDQALDLLARFDLDRVERQVAWMGRRAEKPRPASWPPPSRTTTTRRRGSREAGEARG